MVWKYRENVRKQSATGKFKMGTRGKAKKGKTRRGYQRQIQTEKLSFE
jgi:hypothetical protein